jgi:hypothetical protein
MSSIDDVFKDLEKQLNAVINAPDGSKDSQLREEVNQWKKKTAAAEERASILETKLKKLILGIKGNKKSINFDSRRGEIVATKGTF